MSTAKKTKTSKEAKRLRKVPNHQSFKLTKKRLKPAKPLPGIWSLLKDAYLLVISHKKLYFGLILIQAVLIFIFSRGLGSAFSFLDTRQELFDLLGEEDKSFGTSYFLFTYLLGASTGATSSIANLYQLLILLITVLATIWITRQIFAGQKARIKDAFYQGMYPIIPFVLLFGLITLQLIPALIGNYIFATVLQGGLAITPFEQFIWFLVFFFTSILSIYWVIPSFFALNIVTLQNTGPIEAYKSARDLVLHRRLGIVARLVLLFIISLVIVTIIFLPLIALLPVVVEPLFLLFSSAILIYVTVYMYNFYRGLL